MQITDPQLREAAINFCKTLYRGRADGHDLPHTLRVYETALRLAKAEGANEERVALAALLHDADDEKLSPATAAEQRNARAFFTEHDVAKAQSAAILHIIAQVSFRKNGGAMPDSIEAACVRDADRLDAIGAIGIARTFAYGGAAGRAMYAWDAPERFRANGSDTLSHFYKKLLRLKDMMCTESGKALAEKRHAFMEAFLSELHEEIGEALPA